jgi:NTP pyrophosphatase (non-canonical NTP hydrolase)
VNEERRREPTPTFHEYAEAVHNLAFYPNTDTELGYPTLGLCGEAGEMAEKILGLCGKSGLIANKVKKVYRDGTPVPTDALVDELGDVLWYVAALANALKTPLEEVARRNLEKLHSRRERGTLRGSGDGR